MPYITGQGRGQLMLFPESIDEYVSEDNPVRVIDAFVGSINIEAMAFERATPAKEGRPGYDPSYLGCAFGNAACRKDFKARYYRVDRLLTTLAIGRGDGSYNKLIKDLKKTDLLILDDWGMTVFDPAGGRDLLEVVEDRFGCRSTIIAGQLPVKQWHSLFEDSTVADAVLDRLVHNAYRFELKGPSKRRNDLLKLQNDYSSIESIQ